MIERLNDSVNLIGLTIVVLGAILAAIELHFGKEPTIGSNLITGGVSLIGGHALALAKDSNAPKA